MIIGNSLAVQWLGLCTLTAVAWAQSLVWELRSRKLCSATKKKKKKITKVTYVFQCGFDGNSYFHLPLDWAGQAPSLPCCQHSPPPPPLRWLGDSATLPDSLLHLSLFTFQFCIAMVTPFSRWA